MTTKNNPDVNLFVDPDSHLVKLPFPFSMIDKIVTSIVDETWKQIKNYSFNTELIREEDIKQPPLPFYTIGLPNLTISSATLTQDGTFSILGTDNGRLLLSHLKLQQLWFTIDLFPNQYKIVHLSAFTHYGSLIFVAATGQLSNVPDEQPSQPPLEPATEQEAQPQKQQIMEVIAIPIVELPGYTNMEPQRLFRIESDSKSLIQPDISSSPSVFSSHPLRMILPVVHDQTLSIFELPLPEAIDNIVTSNPSPLPRSTIASIEPHDSSPPSITPSGTPVTITDTHSLITLSHDRSPPLYLLLCSAKDGDEKLHPYSLVSTWKHSRDISRTLLPTRVSSSTNTRSVKTLPIRTPQQTWPLPSRILSCSAKAPFVNVPSNSSRTRPQSAYGCFSTEDGSVVLVSSFGDPVSFIPSHHVTPRLQPFPISNVTILSHHHSILVGAVDQSSRLFLLSLTPAVSTIQPLTLSSLSTSTHGRLGTFGSKRRSERQSGKLKSSLVKPPTCTELSFIESDLGMNDLLDSYSCGIVIRDSSHQLRFYSGIHTIDDRGDSLSLSLLSSRTLLDPYILPINGQVYGIVEKEVKPSKCETQISFFHHLHQ
ncbi:hypothetical protein BLNAU_348 [Blattamonas nauphoetae]|uniref:Uncharacterized protein n=1 Tax=Blattamonas nauphoetae TaxID=2049346 RepID=A0ABQ9YL12_9EUKA|nr:hypothetical protein BLNAU_348 [Blattamonas nauphoetae]